MNHMALQSTERLLANYRFSANLMAYFDANTISKFDVALFRARA